MKRKTILTMLFATFILTANAQEKVSQQEKVCEEPHFFYQGRTHLFAVNHRQHTPCQHDIRHGGKRTTAG